MDNSIAKLFKSPKTVFTTKDLAILWQETNTNNLKSKISYYVQKGSVIRLTRGVFAKQKNYNPKEFATSLYTPSYISFETVLREAGVIFQYYDTVFAAARWSKNITINGQSYTFRKLKDVVLYTPSGIMEQGTCAIATKERALLDMIYLFPDYYFDNLRGVDWKTCFRLAPLYDNKQFIERVKKYYKHYAE